MDVEEWHNGRRVWAPVIGRLLLAFGQIEWCVTVCLGPLNDPEDREQWRNAEFKRKTSESIRVLTEKHRGHPASKAAIRCLNEALKLVSYRNLVAHNPLNIGMCPDGNDVKIQLIVASLRHPDVFIDFSELTEIMEAAENIADELHFMVDAIWKIKGVRA